METVFARIAEVVEKHPNRKLQTLVHAINQETLEEQHKIISGSKATGVDGITKENYGDNLTANLDDLIQRMKNQAYKPQPVRRVYIPKVGSDKMRGLGIPAYEDKLVQGVIAKVMNIIYEPKFLKCSYGFRPKLSCHDAIKELGNIIEKKKISYIVDAYIKGFFDNVDHEWLIKFLEHDIEDKNFLRLIKRFLKAGIMEEGNYLRSDLGTPQGGIISPILANVYLHFVLDLWFEYKVKKYMNGDCEIVRYADDFVCCFQYKTEAELFYKELIKRLNKFNLQIAEDKTKIIEFGRFASGNRGERGEGKPETFDFLGFTHYCSKSKNGYFRVKRKTSRKKFNAKAIVMKEWLKDNMHTPIVNLIKKLNVKLVGHYRYYGITDNHRRISVFYWLVCETLYKILKRRTRKDGLTWNRYARILEFNPIAKPKIYVNVYE